MPLTKQQTSQIKEKLLKQLANFPEEKQEEMKKQILSMNEQEFEEFLKQNQLIQNPQSANQCIFCSIIDNKIPSYKIDENKNNIAILEINPLSKGHSLVIPKQHIKTEKIPSNSFTLAKKIAKKIKSKLKPKDIQINTKNMLGHSLIEILPVYGNETGERKKAPEEDLKKLQEQLKAKPRKEQAIKLNSKGQIMQKEKKELNLPKLKPRIP